MSANVAAVRRSTCRVPDGMAAASRCSPKQLGQALRMDKLAELVGEHEVRVDVRVSGECAREDLRLLVCAQHVDRLGASATVRRERADFGGPNVQPARVGQAAAPARNTSATSNRAGRGTATVPAVRPPPTYAPATSHRWHAAAVMTQTTPGCSAANTTKQPTRTRDESQGDGHRDPGTPATQSYVPRKKRVGIVQKRPSGGVFLARR